ncbi:hypothetical protein [Streptomyces sp. NBC_00996]|uniref:hypothetical protein n=1 Tax=Streptomyces sp. NBC_00996 TaxID=2903710 RepID=UPI00387033BC|nr:hypothetical protein OG390_00980 [Streptomyces sp. NBC_00996]
MGVTAALLEQPVMNCPFGQDGPGTDEDRPAGQGPQGKGRRARAAGQGPQIRVVEIAPRLGASARAALCPFFGP